MTDPVREVSGSNPGDWRSNIPGVGPVTVLTAIYALGYLAWERSGLGSQAFRDFFGTAAFMPLNLTVAVLYLLAARNQLLHPDVRRAIRFAGVGTLCTFLGNCISVYHIVALGESPPVSWADLFYLTDMACLLAACLAFPLTRRINEERWKFVLDAAMVLLGGGAAIWYFTVLPSENAHQNPLVVTMMTFAYPLASLVLLLGITTVLLRKPIDGNRWAFGLLVTGITASVVADLTFGLVQLDTGDRSASWTDAVYLVCYLMMVASAELYYRRPVPGTRRSTENDDEAQPLSPLPYLAAAVTFGILLNEVLRPWNRPVTNLVVFAIAITLLVVARQVLAVRQNVRLLRETSARQNEARFRSLVQNSSDVIIVAEADATIRFVSPSVSRVLNYVPERLLGLPVHSLLVADDKERARNFFHDACSIPGVTPPVEWGFRQPDGSTLLAETLATNLLHDPTVRGIVLNIRDISERKRLEKQLHHQAFHDPLTGLANRALFRDRVSHALTLARRQGRAIIVLFLDLDDFKKVNDSLGHSEGDRLLVAAAERFQTCARAADTVARLGGDEFAILIEDVPTSDGHTVLVERLSSAMRKPFQVSGNEVHVSASVGIAIAGDDDTADDLLRNADVAMYSAKRRGKGRTATYEAQMVSDSRQRLEMEAALRGAIERDELVLHYQPIFFLQSGRICGVEALVRWEHPRYGHLLPQHFIPLAEETGLIVKLGGWVLHQACRQVQQWREAYPADRLTVSVNISGRQLQEPELVEEARGALADTGVDPDALVLEITESVLMQQTGSVLEQLQDMKALGVQLAIDDFGTGYSSLSYLQRFPIDILKIAKPFIDDVGAGIEKSALARAIIGLGDTLKLRTIAEGIEVAEQRAALITLGCELGQGYFFAPPLPSSGIDRMLAEQATATVPTRVAS